MVSCMWNYLKLCQHERTIREDGSMMYWLDITRRSLRPYPGGRLQVFLPGCVSMGLQNRPILKGLNDNSGPY